MEIKLVKPGFMLTIDNMVWNYLISKNPQIFWETKRSRLEGKRCWENGQGDEWRSLHGLILFLEEWDKGQIEFFVDL